MGNLLGIGKEGRKPTADLFLDFENAQPIESEVEVHAQVASVLTKSASIIRELDEYKGAGEQIRLAISNASDENLQNAAWLAVCPLVGKLKEFWMYSADIQSVLPVILEALVAKDPLNCLREKQAITKQFAEIIQFVMRFDDLKMNNPAIQNDFSYYRRMLSRQKITKGGAEEQAVVSSEDANRMSLFYAYPTPMLKILSDATASFVSENQEIPIENTTDCLSAMANVCRVMIEPEFASRFTNPQTVVFCQQVLVGTIILYDHVHLVGAFSKKNTSIDVPKAIKALKLHTNPEVEGLMNALRYTTKHLNDEDTPKSVKALLA
eukprot:m.119881 g.119881  ORF g.119881 m.119881 type:complete len:322 (-) comp16163_c1_seq1:1375-2340(-)